MTDPMIRDELVRLCGDDPQWAGVLEQYDSGARAWLPPETVDRVRTLRRSIGEAAEVLAAIEHSTDEVELRTGINGAVALLVRSLADPKETP